MAGTGKPPPPEGDRPTTVIIADRSFRLHELPHDLGKPAPFTPLIAPIYTKTPDDPDKEISGVFEVSSHVKDVMFKVVFGHPDFHNPVFQEGINAGLEMAAELITQLLDGETANLPHPPESMLDKLCDRVLSLQAALELRQDGPEDDPQDRIDLLQAERDALKADAWKVLYQEVTSKLPPAKSMTQGERHLINLLSWRESENAELKREIARLSAPSTDRKYRCGCSAVSSDKIEAFCPIHLLAIIENQT